MTVCRFTVVNCTVASKRSFSLRLAKEPCSHLRCVLSVVCLPDSPSGADAGHDGKATLAYPENGIGLDTARETIVIHRIDQLSHRRVADCSQLGRRTVRSAWVAEDIYRRGPSRYLCSALVTQSEDQFFPCAVRLASPPTATEASPRALCLLPPFSPELQSYC